MKKISSILCILMASLFLFVSCQSSSTGDIQKRNDVTEANGELITIIQPLSATETDDDEYGAYASELMVKKGFNIEFLFYKVNPLDGKIVAQEKYKEFVKSNLSSGKNIIFEAWGDFDDFENNDKLLKISETDEYYITNSSNIDRYNYIGVFIKKELDDEFGKTISKLDDYEEYLYWVKDTYPEMNPALMYIQDYDLYYQEYNVPLEFFAQANGYLKASSLFYWEYDFWSTAYYNLEDIKEQAVDNIFKDAVELPFFLEMDEKLNKWSGDGVMTLSDNIQFTNFSDSSSFIQRIFDFTDRYSIDKVYGEKSVIDAGEYNLHLVTDYDLLKTSPLAEKIDWTEYLHPPRFAVYKDSPSRTEAAAFLNWIYESSDNYNYFMFGVEGVDYELEDDRITFLTNDKGLRYGEWYGHSPYYNDMYAVCFPHWPQNWLEIKEILDNSVFIDCSTVSGIQYSTIKEAARSIQDEYRPDDTYDEYRSDIISKYMAYYKSIRLLDNEYDKTKLQNDVITMVPVQKFLEYYNALIKLYKIE